MSERVEDVGRVSGGDQDSADRPAALLDLAAPASQADSAYEVLLDRVVSLELAPGRHLSESELSSLAGLGRSPVREAVQRLELDGFVRVLPRRGVLVTPLDLHHQTDVWEMRMELEPAAARMAAQRMADSEVEALRQLHRSTAPAGDASDPAHRTAWVDRHLHTAIAAGSRNRLLAEALRILFAHVRRQWNAQNRRGWRESHEIAGDWQTVVDAIAARDPQAAYDLMRQHVSNARSGLQMGF